LLGRYEAGAQLAGSLGIAGRSIAGALQGGGSLPSRLLMGAFSCEMAWWLESPSASGVEGWCIGS
jgi:hypothetical protein